MNGSDGVLRSRMRWDLGAAQAYRLHRADGSPTNVNVNPQGEAARDRAMNRSGVVEDPTVHRDKAPVTQGDDPGMDHTPLQDARLTTDARPGGTGGGDPHLTHRHRAHRTTGIPTSRSWTTLVGGGVRRGSADETLRRSMSRSSSGGFARESERWLGRTFNMLQPTRESRIS